MRTMDSTLTAVVCAKAAPCVHYHRQTDGSLQIHSGIYSFLSKVGKDCFLSIEPVLPSKWEHTAAVFQNAGHFLTVHNTHRPGAKLASFAHKPLHHRPMCKQEVINRIWIQLCKVVVNFVGIFTSAMSFGGASTRLPERTAVTCSNERVFCSIAREE